VSTKKSTKKAATKKSPKAKPLTGEQAAAAVAEMKSRTDKPAKSRTKKAVATETKPGRVSQLDAAATILADAGTSMNCKAMVEAMTSRGLWTSPGGKTPDATLYSAILREITTKGTASRFVKKDRGQFALAGQNA